MRNLLWPLLFLPVFCCISCERGETTGMLIITASRFCNTLTLGKKPWCPAPCVQQSHCVPKLGRVPGSAFCGVGS